MSALDAPTPSTRAKSQSALDMAHGRRGGWLRRESDHAQDEAFRAAIDRGSIVVAHCLCTRWWLGLKSLGGTCRACGERMVAERRFVLLDEADR